MFTEWFVEFSKHLVSWLSGGSIVHIHWFFLDIQAVSINHMVIIFTVYIFWSYFSVVIYFWACYIYLWVSEHSFNHHEVRCWNAIFCVWKCITFWQIRTTIHTSLLPLPAGLCLPSTAAVLGVNVFPDLLGHLSANNFTLKARHYKRAYLGHTSAPCF